MNDLISRKALLEAFSADTQHLRCWDVDLYDLMVAEIEDAPAAEAKLVQHGQWISVNDFLPKTSGRFMVTIKSRSKRYVDMRNFDHVAKKWGSARWASDNVIAWQARPEPYLPNCGVKIGSEESVGN